MEYVTLYTKPLIHMKHIYKILLVVIFFACTIQTQAQNKNTNEEEPKIKVVTGLVPFLQAELQTQKEDEEPPMKTNMELHGVVSISCWKFTLIPYCDFTNQHYGAEVSYEFKKKYETYIVSHRAFDNTKTYTGLGVKRQIHEYGWLFIETGQFFPKEGKNPGPVVYLGVTFPVTFTVWKK